MSDPFESAGMDRIGGSYWDFNWGFPFCDSVKEEMKEMTQFAVVSSYRYAPKEAWFPKGYSPTQGEAVCCEDGTDIIITRIDENTLFAEYIEQSASPIATC